jgi:hypothetical protein
MTAATTPTAWIVPVTMSARFGGTMMSATVLRVRLRVAKAPARTKPSPIPPSTNAMFR